MFFLSPQMFLFFCIYLFFLSFMACVDSFFMFWSIIEFRTLVFIGLSYSAFKNSFSRLLIFFIIQSYSAFIILIFFCINFSFGFTFTILLKLSIFPFYFWYLSVIPLFSNFMFWFSSTFFKIPSIIILYNFFYILNYNVFFISRILTIFFGALAMLSSNDLRFILISSSVVNNSWFFFSQIVRLLVFLVYFLVYFLILTAIVYHVHFNSSTNFLSYCSIKHTNFVVVSLLTLSGLPPFPLFFSKMLVVFILLANIQYFFIVLLLLFVSVLTLVGYLKYVFNILIYSYFNVFYTTVN